MPLDASIYGQVGKFPSLADYDLQRANVEGAQQSNQLNALKILAGRQQMADSQRMMDEQTGARGALSALSGGADMEQRARALEGLGTQTGFSMADALRKSHGEQQKTTAEVNSKNAGTATSEFDLRKKRLEFSIQGLSSSSTADEAKDHIVSGVQRGDIDLDTARQMAAKLPTNPQDFAKWRNDALLQAVDAKDQLKFTRPDANAVLGAQTSTSNNAATNARMAAEGAAGRAQSERHFGVTQAREATAPKGIIVQSESGPLLVDSRTGQGQPVTVDGQAVGQKLKDAPAQVQKAMIENGTNLRRAEKALALIEGADVGDMKGDKSATGVKGYLPAAVLNRADPKGVDTRAQLADLGSLVIHDRSGAVVTASEFPRLQPFIPSATDDAATAKKKVRRFVQIYRDEIAATQQAYGPESGYRQLGASPAGIKAGTDLGGGFTVK
jgi:hypothetical protein